MATIVYANGNQEVTVAANEKIAVFSWAPVQIYQTVGYPNFPQSTELLYTTSAGEQYVSSAFSSGALLSVQPGASDAFYETGSAPTVSEPQTDITAADATFNVQGLAAAQGGYVRMTGGTSSTSANAGGAAQIVGGQPGATGVGGAASVTGGAGGSTSGAGGAANVTGGAGTAGNANGGSVVLTPGAANGSGFAGNVQIRGVMSISQGAPTPKTVSATLTAAEVAALIITVNQGAAGASALQLPLASAMDTGFPNFAAGDAFDFSVINISTVAAEDASLTTNTGWTLVGNMDVASNATAADKSAGRFRARKTGSAAWSLYRLS